MINYSLATLLKVRQYDKLCAERTLREAIQTQELEEKKFLSIREKISYNKYLRAKIADSFFEKMRLSPGNGPDIRALIYSVKKNIGQEETLRKNLAQQEKNVQSAKENHHLASQNLVEAHINLKIISNHHSSWHQQVKRTEELSIQNETDDQNGARFCLKNRVDL